MKQSGVLDKSLTGDRRTRTNRRGIVEVLPAGNHFGSIRDLKPLAGGQVLVGGFVYGRFMAARFNRDGSLDRSFGHRGVSSFDLDGDPNCECSFGKAMVRDRHKRILIAGNIVPESKGDDLIDPEGNSFNRSRLAVIRLKRNGTLDRSFGVNGVVRLPQEFDARANSIAIQRDGRIVVAGKVDDTFGLVRFTQAGGLDQSFFSDGLYTEPTLDDGEALDVMIDNRGRIVASGGSGDGKLTIKRFLTR
jgi:uncharacterized delta-60 repeat protein